MTSETSRAMFRPQWFGSIALPVAGLLIGLVGAEWGALVGAAFGSLIGSLLGALIVVRKRAEAIEECPVSVHPARLQAIRESSLSLPRVRPLPRAVATASSASAILSDL